MNTKENFELYSNIKNKIIFYSIIVIIHIYVYICVCNVLYIASINWRACFLEQLNAYFTMHGSQIGLNIYILLYEYFDLIVIIITLTPLPS